MEKQFQVGNLAKTFSAEQRVCCALGPYLKNPRQPIMGHSHNTLQHWIGHLTQTVE